MTRKKLALTTLCLASLCFSSCTKEKTVNMDQTISQKQGTPLSSRGLASNEDLIGSINSKIVAMDSPYKVIPLIRELEALAAQKDQENNASVQLYKIAARPLAKLDGIAWRFRKIVEKSGALHLAALGIITKAFHREYMYGPHIMALLEYATGPSTTGVEMFETIGEAQDFLEKELRPEVQKSLTELTELTNSLDDSWSLKLDGHLLSGHDPAKNIQFISEKHRFKKVIKPHLYYGISSLHRALGFIDYAINYNVDQFPKFVNKMVSKTAINNSKLIKTLTNKLPQITTPREASEILFDKKAISKKHRFANFLTLRKSKEDANRNLKSAMNNFMQASSFEKKALLETIQHSDLGNPHSYIINPEFLVIGKDSTVRRLDEMQSLYQSASQGKAQLITSETTGKQTRINLAALFTAHSDLKSFLPKAENFSNEKRVRRLKWKSGREELSWNYHYGRPASYPDPTFGGFLPEATNATIFSIARDMKLTESLKVFSDYLPIP